ncbi:hypothetical protein ACT17_14865 [Mycolicibacterium conceptionense]|uniref:PE domain-containing protein n=1 Tax=Mycolicibacterium conceptionense TaxID=451644 RepID=A0A0J8UB17_9MYCO|nr:hypothetical protein [Mycolicibacterium conceptionense]KMV17575.1 hypothetical protein ACT17_14865 [Mycolicibacterium conceptionense]
MTDENEIAIHDRQGFLSDVTSVAAVRLAPGSALGEVPGATDADSTTSAVVSKTLSDASTVLGAGDTALSGAVTSLRAFYTQVTGIDAAGQTRVLEA